MYTKDELFMKRALDLAKLGSGNVSPNPLVGCVIVCDDRIIGEGWHQQVGGPHAEVNAINSVADKTLLASSVLYVSLEPCSHFGRTPPCADLVIKHQLKKVVIGMSDPNPKVNGAGIKKLREAGVDTEVGVLEDECRILNKRFVTQIERKRPYVILKWAQTSDAFIARENFNSKWISNSLSRQLVHRWRTEEDAVLVGFNTAKHDNPKLTVRDWTGRNPTRIVLDRDLQLDKTLHLFDRSVSTLCYNQVKEENQSNLKFVKTDWSVGAILGDLRERGIQSVMVEGGSATLKEFIGDNQWDEARVFQSSSMFANGIGAPKLPAPISDKMEIENDTLNIYFNESNQR